MSHYLAEIMERAQYEENLEEKEKYEQQVIDLILKLPPLAG
ncbi:hypothetical protein [Vibrio sp. 10N.261.49.A3]